MDRGVGQGTVHGVAESDAAEQLTLSLLSFFQLKHNSETDAFKQLPDTY